jgi:hypothetical protein
MSWECRYRSGEHCNKLEVTCDPGRKGCVLHGKVYFPFAPEKNPKGMGSSERSDRDRSGNGKGSRLMPPE